MMYVIICHQATSILTVLITTTVIINDDMKLATVLYSCTGISLKITSYDRK